MEDFKIIEIGQDLNEKNYAEDEEMAGKEFFLSISLDLDVNIS